MDVRLRIPFTNIIIGGFGLLLISINTDLKKTGTYIGARSLALASKKLSETALDTPALVGEASGEMKITDAASGEVLAAVVDRRLGSGKFEKSVSSWGDVYNIFEYWSGMVDIACAGNSAEKTVNARKNNYAP